MRIYKHSLTKISTSVLLVLILLVHIKILYLSFCLVTFLHAPSSEFHHANSFEGPIIISFLIAFRHYLFIFRLKPWMDGRCTRSSLIELGRKLEKKEYPNIQYQCLLPENLMFRSPITLTLTHRTTHSITR